MSYKEESFFKDIITNEKFYIAVKNKKMIRHTVDDKEVVCIWTDRTLMDKYIKYYELEYDRVVEKDIDEFVTYEMDDIFEEKDEILVNVTDSIKGHFINVIEVTEDIMTELDRIRMKEFVQDVAKDDTVYGLTNKNAKQFIMISEHDDREDKHNVMPVWSLKSRARKVMEADFEECDLIEIEGEVFGEWLDQLRDDHAYVGIDLKPGVIGTIVSAQKLSDELTF